jgi:TIR domain/Trypsin-like peptidase domain
MADDRPIDVLISYKSEERAVAERLARALSTRWQVWWDHELLAGDSYRRVIGEKLAVARCVIVLWSTRSVESDFVLDEAGRALRRGVLIPARIDAVDVPLGFGQHDYADLIDWDGAEDHPGYQELCRSITRRVAGTPGPSPPAAAIPPRPRLPFTRRQMVVATAAALLGLLSLLLVVRPDDSTDATAAAGAGPNATPPASTTGAAPRPEPAATGESAASERLVAVEVEIGQQVVATGLILPSGLVVTPCHVAGEAQSVTIRGSGRWDGPARIVGRQCDVDAVLLEPAGGPILPNGSVIRLAGSLKVGEAIERYRNAGDRTPGTVIATSERVPYMPDVPARAMLVTTNVTSGGDSGAPVRDAEGRIVGMIVAGGADRSLATPIETLRQAFITRFARP